MAHAAFWSYALDVTSKRGVEGERSEIQGFGVGAACDRSPRRRTSQVLGPLLVAMSLASAGCAGEAYVGVSPTPVRQTTTQRPEQVAQRAAVSVVRVETDVGEGMGFVIDPAGYVVTSRHVVEEVGHVNAVVWPGVADGWESRSVEIAYIDPVHDLALLKVSPPSDEIRAIPLTGAGDEAFDVEGTGRRVVVTAAVDAPDLSLAAEVGAVSDLDVRNEAVGPGPYLGVTNPIVRGQSGGPVLDLRGRAVGVVTWIWKDKPGGFAIPSNRVVEMLDKRPLLNTPSENRARVEARIKAFTSAVENLGEADPRRFIAPSSARQIRSRTVGILRARLSPQGMMQFAQMLDQLAAESEYDAEMALMRLNVLVTRTMTRDMLSAMGLEGVLPRQQVVTFFLEFGKAYLSGRIYGAYGREESLQVAQRRLQTLDSGRTFLMAEFLTMLEGVEPRVEELTITPGAYGPRAVARLSTTVGGAREPVYVQLAMEWGDWYIVDVHRRDGAPRGKVASVERDDDVWNVRRVQVRR